MSRYRHCGKIDEEQKMASKILSLLLLLAAPVLNGCGILPGGAAVPHDPTPVGTVVAAGTLQGLSGKTLSGAASVYQLTSDASYVVRLEGIVVPNESALQIVGETNLGREFHVQLRALTGTQNYPTGIRDLRTWVAIYIHSSQNSVTPDYGKATLLAPVH